MPGPDEVRLHSAPVGPRVQRLPGKLWPIVHHEHLRHAARRDHRFQLAHHTLGWQPPIHDASNEIVPGYRATRLGSRNCSFRPDRGVAAGPQADGRDVRALNFGIPSEVLVVRKRPGGVVTGSNGGDE